MSAGFLIALLLNVRSGFGEDKPYVAPVLPPDANTTCPVMTAEEVDPEIFVEYQGRKVYLCCTSCRKSFKKDPEKYMKLLPGVGKKGAAGSKETSRRMAAVLR